MLLLKEAATSSTILETKANSREYSNSPKPFRKFCNSIYQIRNAESFYAKSH
jgi:hypothetical protein